jgi:hypothetical protein
VDVDAEQGDALAAREAAWRGTRRPRREPGAMWPRDACADGLAVVARIDW